MKKGLLFIIMLFGMFTICSSQNLIDVLYLKNGSVIRGQIIEQIPDKTVKIETYDGSIFVYNMDQVDDIITERVRQNRKRETIYIKDSYPYYSLRGYKGFVSAGFNVGDYQFTEISTSHGFQFNNHIFLGGGLGVNYYDEYDITTTAFFANFRANFMKSKITPFADVKLGYSVGDIDGAYSSLSIGVRFSLKNKKALHFIFGYTGQVIEDYDAYYYHAEDYMESFGVKFGFEF